MKVKVSKFKTFLNIENLRIVYSNHRYIERKVYYTKHD